MERRNFRSKKGKPRNDRTYDRHNQSIFGKVCSTVKGLLNPSWLFNVSHWISNADEETPGGSSNDIQEEDNDVVSQSVSHGSKRLRLDDNFKDCPSIQSSGTQTWNEQPSRNLYHTISHISAQSSATQSSLLENKETMAVLNGDDHSENSEGSASTSGCSSLVSSHKESNRLGDNSFASSFQIKSRKRKEPSTSGYNDLNSSSGLWSSSFSPSSKFQRRIPSVSHSNQPSFNLSTFAGPSKLNDSSENKILSPFYKGNTTFGGASTSRRMPASVAPYQVDKCLRNQIRDREQASSDNIKCMSSAAKRILMTLEKMSSPVADAKKIPNLNTSPLDFSLYLTPPKLQRNSQFTPSVATKGPPIVNINNIAKVTTLKNFGTNRLRNTLQNTSVMSDDQKTPLSDQLDSYRESLMQKSGGGKMKNRFNQQHHSSKSGNAENEVSDTSVLKSIPLPISTLPLINFGLKTEKPLSNHLSGFTFSNPIEHDLSITNAVPTPALHLPSNYDSFKFSNPIEHELPNSNAPSEEKDPLPTWECNTCWVRNPESTAYCLACETSRDLKENNYLSETPSIAFQFGIKKPDSTTSTFGTATCSTFAKCEPPSQIPYSVSQMPVSCESPSTNFTFSLKNKISKVASSTPSQIPSIVFGSGPGFTFGNPKETVVSQDNDTLTNTAAPAVVFGNSLVSKVESTSVSTTTISSGTWKCKKCESRNAMKDTKCSACEASHTVKDTTSDVPTITTSTAVISAGMNSGSWECNTCWIKNPMKESKCMACETPRFSKDEIKEVASSSSAFSTWECTSCWVRNPMKEKKCIACETLHPSAETNSVLKEDGFKFSSPLQNSPITFKFGNYVCTASSTVTTSSFKFGVSASESQINVITTSGSKLDAPSGTSTFFKPVISATPSTFPETSPHSTTVTSSTKLPDIACSSEKTQSGHITVGDLIKLAAKKKSESKFLDLNKHVPNEESQSVTELSSITHENKVTETVKNRSTELKESVSEHSNVSSDHKISGTVKDSFVKPKESLLEPSRNTSEILNSFKLDNNCEVKLPDNVIKNHSPNVSFSKENEVPCPSVTACFGFNTQPVLSVTKDTKVKKQSSVFPSVSESQTVSAFTSPVNLFKFGENVNSQKNNASTTSVALTTATTPSFSFSCNNSNFSTAASSKVTETACSASESQPVIIKTEDSKVPVSTSVSSVATTGSFVFGSAVTTTTPTSFSFFPSSSAPTSSAPAPVFTFGASSNMPQVSKSGGFTFKGLDKPQITPAASSTSQTANSGINVTTPASASSGGFVFGTPKIESQSGAPISFAFGSAATTSSSNTSTFSVFQPSQPTNTNFQFGSQPSASTASTLSAPTSFGFVKSEAPNQIPSSASQNPVASFGSTTNFVFGSKTETSIQTSGAASQPSGLAFGSTGNFTFNNKTENNNTTSQNPTLTFGSTMTSVFGNTTQPTFDGSDKPANTGFNFGAPASSVFQFGSSGNTEKKRSATASGFSFGTPAPSETNNSLSTGFNMNTPPSFNFGASSTPTGPFQFAASAPARPASQNTAPRKIRKALRRVTRRE